MGRLASLSLWAVLFSFGVFLFTHQSPYLDDPDSVNFALGVQHFDPADGRPHPPGYPVYIAVAKAVRPFFGTETAALTALSSASVLFLALFAYTYLCAFFPRPAVVLGLALFLALPLTGLEGTKAMTDFPGLAAAFGVLCASKYFFERSTTWAFYASGFLVGLLGGVRPHVWLFVLPITAVQCPPAARVRALLGFLLGIAGWLLPTFWFVGAARYCESVFAMFFGRFCRIGISPLGSSSVWDWVQRFAEYPYFFFYSGMGINLREMGFLDWAIGMGLAGLVAAACFGWRSSGKLRNHRWALAGYFLYLLLFLPASNARYLLPIFVWGSVELTSACLRAIPRATYVLVPMLVAGLFVRTVDLVRERDASPPPAFAGVRALQEQAKVERIALFGFRHSYFKYFWPEASFSPRTGPRCESLKQALQTYASVYAFNNGIPCPGLRVELWRTFRRNAQVHWKESESRVWRVRLNMPK